MPDASTRFYDLGPFRLDAVTCLLFRDGKRVPIRPKASEILRVLVRHHGELVERDLLLGEVWPEANVEEGNISQYILELRKLFRPQSNGEEWIETVPRRGYRFVGLVRAVEESHATSAADTGLDSRFRGTDNPDVVPRRRMALAAISAAAVLVGATALGYRVLNPPQPRVLNVVELTHDALPKSENLFASDGSRLYFVAGDPETPYSVPITGGESIPANALRGLREFDISPDGSKILAVRFDPPRPPQLLVVPVRSGVPHRLGTLNGNYPAWSPDGKEVAFCDGHSLLVARADGTDLRTVARMPSGVFDPHWSPDGNTIRFGLGVLDGGRAIWEVRRNGNGLRQVVWRWGDSANEHMGRWTADGRFFVFVHKYNDRGCDLWARHEKCGVFFWECGRLFQLTNETQSYYQPVPSSDGKKIYTFGRKYQEQLMRYDLPSQLPAAYLALVGTPASEVDFSRDSQWIAYKNLADDSIWRSRIDGSEKLRLTFPPVHGYQPHWSPDSKQIAFLDEASDRFKISIVPAEGGRVTELAPEMTGEGVPTWSRDGKSILYGEPLGRHDPQAMSIHLLNLLTHQSSVLPGSSGLWTARWSPDGRYIVALVLDPSRAGDSVALHLFDMANKRWSALAEVDHIEEPTWSANSRYVYFNTYGGDPALYRVRVLDRQLERLGGLKGVTLGPSSWAGVAPDGSPLITSDKVIQQIYALEIQWP